MAMSLGQLIDVPRHLLAATILRGRDRVPVRVKDVGRAHVVLGPSPLALRERARVTIQSPLQDAPVEVELEAVRKNADSTWLSVVA